MTPSSGTLPAAGRPGATFVVSFTPTEYGKPAVGSLIITTDDMQWHYEVRLPRPPGGLPHTLPHAAPCHPPQVRGQPPEYVLPEPISRIDNRMDPGVQRRMRDDQRARKNFLRRNLEPRV